MTSTRRTTPTQLAEAPHPRNGLPPLPTSSVLDVLAEELRIRLADLWTLRDSIDTDLTGTAHTDAVAAVATMAHG